MNRDQLEQRISEHLHWDYRVEFENGAVTPLLDPRMRNRHEQRRRYFFDALLGVFGGSLRGQRILDLGCGSGYWSLQAIDADADFVLGVDLKAGAIEQAKLVFEAREVDPVRYRFECANLFDGEIPGDFTVVLSLALMHQVARPVELFEKMQESGADVILLETDLHPTTSNTFELYTLRNPVDGALALIPSRSAVIALADSFGYRTVPLATAFNDETGLDDYRRRRRLAFMCARDRPLDGLTAEEPWPLPWLPPSLDPSRVLKRSRR